jgi:stress-induced morphogen
MKPSELEARCQSLAPETMVKVTDLTGSENHFQVIVHSSAFKGIPRMTQHRMVMDLFQNEIRTGELHALSIKTGCDA